MIIDGNIITADENKMLVKNGIRSRQVILGDADRIENWAEDTMTEEEKADQKAGHDKACKEKIEEIKEQLSATDYKAIKYAEGWLSEEEYAPAKALRQFLREEINRLEKELTDNA